MSKGRQHRQYLARAHAMGGSTTVPAGDTVEVLIELRKRMSYSAIAKHLGTSHNYVTRVIRGEIKRMQPSRHAAIMAMRSHQPTDTSHVDPRGAIRRLQALHAMGYSLSRLEREVGCYSLGAIKDTIYGRTPVVEAQHVEAIRATYERLSMSLPIPANKWEMSGITRARNAARSRGWAPPLAWDDIDRDPTPHGTGRDGRTYRAQDLLAEWHHLRASGESIHQAARQLGVTVDAIEKAGERVAQREAS